MVFYMVSNFTNFKSVFKFGSSSKGLFLFSLFVLLISSCLYVCVPSATAQFTVNVGDETALRDAVNSATGHTIIVLITDIQLTATPLNIASGKNIALTSNIPHGFRLIGASGQDTLTLATNAQLELVDIIVTHASGTTGRGITINTGGTLTLTNTTISGNTVTGTTNAYGGAIYSTGGTLTLTNTTISGNTVQTSQTTDTTTRYAEGGGIYSTGNLTLTNTTITNNTADYGSGPIYGYGVSSGGGIYNTGNLTISNTTLTNNTAYGSSSSYGDYTGSGSGGGIYSTGNLTLTNTTLTNNTATWGGSGGGIHNSGNVTISNTNLTNNTATYGGGIYSTGGTLTIANTTLTHNTAGYGVSYSGIGGGIYSTGGTLTITNTTISDNTATWSGSGGGIYNSGYYNTAGNVTITNTTLTNNIAYNGGGIYSSGGSGDRVRSSVIISNTTLTNNTAKGGNGGGIYNSADAGTLTITNTILTNNNAAYGGSGGGIYNTGYYNTGTLTITNTILTNNNAAYGGGIANTAGNVTITNTTIADNTAHYGNGGGIANSGYYNTAGNVTITNTTIADNTAHYGNGGGIANINNMGTVTVLSGTIANNTATNGGGIYLENGSVELFSGTIANNTATVDGGGVWVAHANLNQLFVSDGVIFSNNRASAAYNRNPADDATYYAQIGSNVVWTTPFTQGYNNYDISYTYGTSFIFSFDVTVNNSYAAVTGAGSYQPGGPVTINAGTRPGYTFTNWTINEGNITLTLPNTPTATFTMPESNIVVTANWQADQPQTSTLNIVKHTNTPYNSVFAFQYEVQGFTWDGESSSSMIDIDYSEAITISTAINNTWTILLPDNFTGTVTIMEITDGQEGWTYDPNPVRVIMFVDGILILESDSAEFNNTYAPLAAPSGFSVLKQTVPSGALTEFNFTVSTSEGGFSLVDGQTWDSGSLLPGTYVISELAVTGWNLSDILVQGASNYTINLAAGTLTLHLKSEENARLVFLNIAQQAPQGGSITVIKDTYPPDTQTTFNFTTTTPHSGFTLTSEESWNSGDLPPAVYTITELSQPGWNLTNIIIVGTTNYTANPQTGTTTLTLEPNQHITIIYQNTKQQPQPGTITVVKTTCPTDASEVFSFVTSISPGIFSLTDADTWQSGPLTPGNYTLTEIAQSGWDLTNIIIIDPTNNSRIDLASRTAFIVLDPGETITILYQNTKQAPDYGSFSVTKVSCPVDLSESFSFVTSAPAGSFNLTDGSSWSSGMLPPGTYTVTELVPSGWELTNILLNDPSGISTVDLATGTATINLQSGTHISIVYQDVQTPPTGGLISVVKVACPTDTCAEFTFVSSAADVSFSLSNGEVWTSGELAPGRYLVTEIMQSGWAIADIVIADPSGTSTADLSTGTATINLQAGTHITIIYQNTEQPCPDCCNCKQDLCQCNPCSVCHQKPCQCSKPCCVGSQGSHRYAE